MSIDNLLDILFNYGALPKKSPGNNFAEKLKAYLLPVIISRFYARRQLLLSAGQVAEYIYFIEKGLARGFYTYDATMKEATHFLWNEHSIITVPDSFFQRQPSELFIEVMPGTQLMAISYQQLMDCINKHPGAEVFSRDLILHYSAHETQRNYDLIFLTAWERYLRLLKTHPNIEQQVSKEIIASYLNITPPSLSRLLKEKGHP